MESQLQEFVGIISNQVGIISDPNVRKQSETLLNKFKKEQPDLFIQLLLLALKQDQRVEIRTFCASQLRKNISEYSETSFEKIWYLLTPQTQQVFKTQIFECLSSETASNVRGLIADCIGEVGSCLIRPLDDKLDSQWPELVSIVWQLFSQDRNTLIESGFRILSNLLLYVDQVFADHRNDIVKLIQGGLSNEDLNIKIGAIEVIGSFIGTLEPKEISKYEHLVAPMMEGTLVLLNKDDILGERALEVVADLSEEEPKFFKNNFGLVFQTVSKICKEMQIDNEGIKRIGLEALILIVERFPSTIKSKDDLKKQILELIFMYMIDQDDEVDDKWKQPAEGFRECFNEDGDNANTHFGMSSIDRLMECVGQNHLMVILSGIVEQMLQNNDWRYPFAALMCLSQVGEYMDDVSDIQNIIPVIFKFTQHSNPKVRYSAFHAIGQISDDMQPDFQTKYATLVFPLLIQGFDDSVPRVQAHALASMTNFMEGVSKEQVNPFLQESLKKSFILLENGCSLIKENALSNVAALAESASSDFNTYHQEIIPIIFKVYQNYSAKEYKQLRGVVIEALTVIADSIDREFYLPYLQDTVQLIHKVQENDLDQVDPQKNFVLTGWSRLTQKYNKEMVQYLPTIIPGIMNVIKGIMDHAGDVEKQTETEDAEGASGHTYQHREAATAMNMLEVFISEMGTDLGPYIQQFTEILLPLCNFTSDEDIRCQASRCLPGLIQCVTSSNRELSIVLVKNFITILYQAAENEFDAETITSQIQGMKGCIEAIGNFLNQEELNDLSEKIIKLLIASDQRKQGNSKLANEDPDLDDDEKALYDLDTGSEEDLHVAIAELLGVLFKTHADQSVQLSEIMYTKFLPYVLGDNVSHKMHKFGIFLIDDMIEFLKFSRISDKWTHLAEALVKFSQSTDCAVRQATTYGIGVFAQETPRNEFSKYSRSLLECLVKALNIPQQEKQTEKTFLHCQANIISAIGKILKDQWVNVEEINQVVDFWLRKLPIRKDKDEALIQHEFLCDVILDNNKNSTLFSNQENYAVVIQIIAKIYNTKFSSKEINAKISQSIKGLSTLEQVKSNWDSITRNLTDDQKLSLQTAATQ